MFYVKHNEDIIQASQDFFKKINNIEQTIITPEQWFATVEKWCKTNKANKVNATKNNKEKAILEKKLKCERCGKLLKYSDGKYTCGKKGCSSFSIDTLIRKIIDAVVEWLSISENVDSVIEDIVKVLETRIKEKQEIIISTINSQRKLLEKYALKPSSQGITSEIINKEKYCEEIKEEIEDLKRKRDFIRDELGKSILLIAKTKYYDLILEDLQKEYPALLELVIHQNMKELRISGNKITVIDNTNY